MPGKGKTIKLGGQIHKRAWGNPYSVVLLPLEKGRQKLGEGCQLLQKVYFAVCKFLLNFAP